MIFKMDIERLTQEIWTAQGDLTFEQARKIAEKLAKVQFTRDTKQTRVVRAEEVR